MFREDLEVEHDADTPILYRVWIGLFVTGFLHILTCASLGNYRSLEILGIEVFIIGRVPGCYPSCLPVKCTGHLETHNLPHSNDTLGMGGRARIVLHVYLGSVLKDAFAL